VNIPFVYSKSANQLVTEIDRDGYAMIENAVPNLFTEKVLDEVTEMAREQGSTFSIVGYENLKASLLGELYRDPEFCHLLKDITSLKIGEDLEGNVEKYQVLRVLNGGDLNSQSHLFHFDNYTLTVLLPIAIPNNEKGHNGDLYLLPNIRKISSSSIKNLIIKTVTQNIITRKLFSIAYFRKVLKFQTVSLVPNNLYFFWGFCSYHGNGDCDVGNLRSTALYHYHKPVKSDDVLGKMIKTKQRARISKK